MQSTDRTVQAGCAGEESARLYYLDWLRVIAIVGVWAYHSVRPFVLQDWLINNAQRSVVITLVFLIFLGTWGMPLFFLMAGAGSWFALRRRTGRQFVVERVQRLLIPFIVGSLLLSPIQFYLEWIHKGWYQGPFLKFLPLLVESRLSDFSARLSPSMFESWGSHLWFLGYLFTFSLLSLPLFLWLKGEPGRQCVVWLAKLAERRGGLLVFIVPPALVRLILQPVYPGYTDWADFGYMLAYFICGYILYADERFLEAIRRDRWLMLVVGTLSTLTMVVLLTAGGGEQWVKDPRLPGFYLAWGLVGVNGWCWTLFALSLGMRILDFRNRWLDYGQELIVPFYMLHQPAIVAVAFYVVQWEASLPVKLVVVVLGSFVVTLSLCEGVVRRIKPARALFGMKPRWSGATVHAED